MLEVIVKTCTDPAPSVIQVDDLVSNVQSAPVEKMNVKIRLSISPEGNELFANVSSQAGALAMKLHIPIDDLMVTLASRMIAVFHDSANGASNLMLLTLSHLIFSLLVG